MFFVAHGLSIGADLPTWLQDYGEESMWAIGIGPRIAYFLGEPEAAAFPFFGVNAGVMQYRWEMGGSSEDEKQRYFGGVGGAVWMLRRNVGISTEVSHMRSSTDDFKTSTLGLLIGIDVFLF